MCKVYQVHSIAYHPVLSWLKKRIPDEWEAVPKPAPPKDLNNPEEVARYDREMGQYMQKTTAMRAKDANRWLSVLGEKRRIQKQ